MKKINIGILGATGMVGQRFITLLSNHPWFTVSVVAASPLSRGKKYSEAVDSRWQMDSGIPESIKDLVVQSVEMDMQKIAKNVDLVFCALDMEREEIVRIEEAYASLGIPVVSCNSANRWTTDVPMIIPEINADHLNLINTQKKNRGWDKGFIVVKPNCSIQSYVAVLTTLQEFKPIKIHVVSMQAISGAGKTFKTWPEMIDNVIPFISGEEEKSEKEPLRIWGALKNGKISLKEKPLISAVCIRVPVSNGHTASVAVSFEKKPTQEQIFKAIEAFNRENLDLPSSPKQFIHYFKEENRPQAKLDRDIENGMGISFGRLKEGKLFDYEFVSLSHNTIRGAAGGAILTAELLVKRGYVKI